MHDVLLIDDDQDTRDRLAMILRDQGYTVAMAANGVEALYYLRSGTKVSIIVLDLLMPVMSGAEFRAEQLRDPQLSDVPVLLVTADVNLGSYSAELRAPILQKPFKAQAFTNALRAAGLRSV